MTSTLATSNEEFPFFDYTLFEIKNEFDDHGKSMLGCGSFGNVSLVRLKSTKQFMAVKLIIKDVDINFEKEFQPLSRLKHRNIVKLFGWTQVLGWKGVLIEHMADGSLDKSNGIRLLGFN